MASGLGDILSGCIGAGRLVTGMATALAWVCASPGFVAAQALIGHRAVAGANTFGGDVRPTPRAAARSQMLGASVTDAAQKPKDGAASVASQETNAKRRGAAPSQWEAESDRWGAAPSGAPCVDGYCRGLNPSAWLNFMPWSTAPHGIGGTFGPIEYGVDATNIPEEIRVGVAPTGFWGGDLF